MTARVDLRVTLVDAADDELTVEWDKGSEDDTCPVTIRRTGSGGSGTLVVGVDDLRAFRNGLTEFLDRYAPPSDEAPF